MMEISWFLATVSLVEASFEQFADDEVGHALGESDQVLLVLQQFVTR